MTVVLLFAGILSLAGVALVLPLLRRAQVIDVPNSRSSHRAPTPRGGGIAVVAAIILSNLVGWVLNVDVAWTLLAGIAAFALIGFVDDVRGLTVEVRLSLQFVLSAGLAAMLLADPGVSLLAMAIAAFALAGYTNAFNFMDGVNGISALNAALAGGWFAFLGSAHDEQALATLGLGIAGASLGFLPWNAPRARVFLGDVGSYGLGFAVAASSLLAWSLGVSPLLAVAPLIIYVADTGWALVKRVRGKRAWREAHREHVYQRLTDRGLSHLESALVSVACAFGVCMSFLALGNTSPLAGVAGATILVSGYLGLPVLVDRRRMALGNHGFKGRQ